MAISMAIARMVVKRIMAVVERLHLLTMEVEEISVGGFFLAMLSLLFRGLLVLCDRSSWVWSLVESESDCVSCWGGGKRGMV